MSENRMVPQFGFPAAVQKVTDGAKVTRLAWGDIDTFILLSEGFLKIRKADRTLHALIVSEGDMLGTDWIVVPEGVVGP